MRPPVLRLHTEDLIVDSFAGGGGASMGIEMATGRSPDIAINHDAEALAMHAANHPACEHHQENVWKIDPVEVCKGRPVALAWFSPDCTFHSKARGAKPFRDKNSAKRRRGLAWVVTRWARAVKPRIICLENVEEFQDWGPLDNDGKPDPTRAGFTYRRWLAQLRGCGYVVEDRQLRACDYGAPTTRKRLFIIARCDGLPIVWPAPTHGKGLLPYRTAAECLDFSIPVKSIFGRKKPLAENTLKRIARGLRRYVIEAADPFIIPVTHAGDARTHSIHDPLPTITGAHRGEKALVTPYLARLGQTGGNGKYANDARDPITTITTKAEHLLVAPSLIQSGWGERKGQAPRALDIQQPIGTLMAEGVKHALVSAFLARHYSERPPYVRAGKSVEEPLPTITTSDHHSLVSAFLARHYGGHENDGASPQLPLPTITTKDHHAVVTAHLTHFYTSNTAGGEGDLRKPMKTITAGGLHAAEVRAFLVAYYGSERDGGQLSLPMRTLTTKPRFGLVTIHGVDYEIADIGMRMLKPRELFRAQGFPASYKIDASDGLDLTQEAQVRMCGNSVCPPLAAAIVRANLAEQAAAGAA